MKARVLSFRRGRHTQKTNQLLLSVKDATSKSSAATFIGKKVVWKTKSGREIKGKIVAVHGNSGTLRARFSGGVSGEVLGRDIDILE
jgi:large subunit ribosomal protein L35Ae